MYILNDASRRNTKIATKYFEKQFHLDHAEQNSSINKSRNE